FGVSLQRVKAGPRPALKKPGLAVLGGFQVVNVGVDLVVQPGDINAVVHRAIILDAHQPLREQVDRPPRRAAVEAQVQAGGEANESLEESLVFVRRVAPDLFQDLVTGEVFAPVKKGDSVSQFGVHNSSYYLNPRVRNG